jgi:hypothetical protein
MNRKLIRPDLRDPRDRETRYLPSHDDYLNWLYLSMAEAYETLGQPAAAAAALDWVKGPALSEQEDFDTRFEQIHARLKLPPKETREYRGEPVRAADFTLEDLQGTQVRLSDYAGKTVLLLLWATW